MRWFILLFLLSVDVSFAMSNAVKVFRERLIPVHASLTKFDSVGTGWWLDSSVVCTAYHVVSEPGQELERVSVEIDGREVLAELVAKNPQYDIALLRPAKRSRFSRVNFNVTPDYGDETYIWGFAPAVHDANDKWIPIFTDSRIAALGSASEMSPYEIIMATTVFTGTSGSPVIDSNGSVLGLILGVQDDGGESTEWYATASPARKIQELYHSIR